MRAIGIDPGIGLTGYGIVEEDSHGTVAAIAYGVISTSPKAGLDKRLQQLYLGICELIECHQPDTAAVEKLFFGRNVTTAITVGQARGVAILAIANAELTLAEYTPAEVKQAIAGYGDATKGQVQEMVRTLLELDAIPRPDDAADGLAIAITHLHSTRYQHLVQ